MTTEPPTTEASDLPLALEPKPGILEIAPYVGGDHKAPGVNRVFRLASNENTVGPSPKAKAAYTAAAGEIHRYPDGNSERLRQTIGRVNRLAPARLVCGAGSDELLQLLTKAYAGVGDEILYSQYGFMMYPIAAKSVGAVPVAAPEQGLRSDVDALLAHVTPRTRILFLANPNNPTGSYLTPAEMRRLHAGLPGNVLLVIDAAYAEYVETGDYEAGVELVDSAQNVVMVRTFSKIYALAGLRLGWMYGPPAVVDVVNRIRGPFNVTLATQEAGVAAMEDEAFVTTSRATATRWRTWLSDELTRLGLTVYPSVANFILVRFPTGPGRDAAAALAFLKERGVLVRGMAGYGLPECLRIGIGVEDEMRAVQATIADFLGSRS
ncbi:histidinol-phosphate aminotransferase [Stella humosa]|uniref:Histidinol-phosphate aminotransferase n=1 Tax=Stella humosa TaxID=94 RepID=A0A3N1LK16_9PROT|nr:histidinol-phosphate transaminase [Stella humosa]ROP91344.1 histidinol-phosphate aminotransferase [Stella humosa]BBK34299.1 histidinol-phosphate aminotransferase [Stella humosa]